jgi:hypothetical protein
MYQEHVSITVPGVSYRLPSADGDHMHLNSGFTLEYRQQMIV